MKIFHINLLLNDTKNKYCNIYSVFHKFSTLRTLMPCYVIMYLYIVLLHSKSTLQTRSNLCIPRNETAQSRSQFPHSWICERFIYSHNRATCFAAAKEAYRYMNVEIGNEAVSFLGIFVYKLRYSVSSVQYKNQICKH